MDINFFLLFFLLLITVGFGGYIIYSIQQSKKTKEATQKELQELLLKTSQIKEISEREAVEKASQIAKNIILEGEKKAMEIENKIQENARRIREQLKDQERNLNEREKKIIERSDSLDKKFDQIEIKEKELENTRNQLQKNRENLAKKLEDIAGMTKQQAEIQLKQEIETELKNWVAKKVRESEQEIRFKSDEVSKEILVEAMISGATDYVAETTTTTINIDDEEIKRKIIGKQGRNIRTFEKLTGVDIIVDETPNQVTLSSFDPIRREVGALALSKLIADGRVHPASIEETVEKVKRDILKEIKKTGEELAYQSGFNNLPHEIIMLLGRFKYRFSYGQNLVKHTLEMVRIGEFLAKELNADVQTAKLACLLHDIGKVAPEEGKQHHHISADIARKFFKDERLINAIEAHHYDIESKYIEAEIVRIADSISGARPGARRDSYEEHIKRVRAIEEIALKNPGVKEAYAIRAGREVRIILTPEKTTDEDTKLIAFNVAKEIESTQSYPGVIKVNVIREVRSYEEAK